MAGQDDIDIVRRLSKDYLIADVENIRLIIQQNISFDNQVLETSFYR